MNAAMLELLCSDKVRSEITGVTHDSRSVKEGFLFCASSPNSHNYLEEAACMGARVLLTNCTKKFDAKGATVIIHDDPRLVYHKICANFWPNQPENIVAVTGTNGKTSICDFFLQICSLSNKKVASIGTLGVRSNIASLPKYTSLTLPDPADLHQLLSGLHQNDVEYCCLEASSQGMHQRRMDSVILKAAAFTNLTQDHIDYHGNFENYFQCKQRLFTELLKHNGIIVLPENNQYADRIASHIGTKSIIRYGTSQNMEIKVLSQIVNPLSQEVNIDVLGENLSFKFNVLGQFQIYNLMAAIGLAFACGIKVTTVDYSKLTAPDGRIMLFEHPKAKNRIFIDYAHNSDGLKNLLSALRWHFPYNNITIVFGCGGNRDKYRRSLMGEIAYKMANKVIITNDNPRNEDPDLIRKEILNHCPTGINIGNRQEAIAYAVNSASSDEIIVIAGRGHEKIQIFADNTVNVSDLELLTNIFEISH